MNAERQQKGPQQALAADVTVEIAIQGDTGESTSRMEPVLAIDTPAYESSLCESNLTDVSQPIETHQLTESADGTSDAEFVDVDKDSDIGETDPDYMDTDYLPKAYLPASETESEASVVLEVSSAVGDLQLHESDRPAPDYPKANLDAVLESLDRLDELESTSENDLSVSPVREQDTLFYVDVQGDSLLSSNHTIVSDEQICFQPRRARTPSPIATFRTSSTIGVTPWARTIDDPDLVPTSETIMDQASNKLSMRVNKAKSSKRPATSTSRQDELDIMLDYMDNARWTDVDSDEDSVGAEEVLEAALESEAITIDDQIIAEHELNGVGASDLADLSDDSEASLDSDDTDIDDDLELTIEAEMEEMEFDLGYSRGRINRVGMHGFRQEAADASLYHEDFNVYDFFSAKQENDEQENDELAADDQLMASGANKRGLNKFINELDLSDEELEAVLVAQWKKDRAGKGSKKRERQRLHKEGLIGKKGKRARMAHALPNAGNDELHSIHEHIKRFVTSAEYAGIEQLPMPVMEKPIRRAAHMIAQIYGLTSSSQGTGKRRYITFYKTARCTVPDADFVEEALFRARRSLGFNSKFRDTLPPDPSRRGEKQQKGKQVKGRSGQDGSRLRDGDLVGADAPEIAMQNKGRQMLEKLGWLRGTGLGAAGNEGMNIPLFATIKISKVGLGT